MGHRLVKNIGGDKPKYWRREKVVITDESIDVSQLLGGHVRIDVSQLLGGHVPGCPSNLLYAYGENHSESKRKC